MKIGKIAGITMLALTTGFGIDYGYRRYQEEPVDRYLLSELGKASEISSKNSNMHEFVKSLDTNYSAITNKLKISETQYKNYRDLAIGIAKEETNFGLDYSSTGKKYFPNLSKWLKKKFGRKSKILSEGITNFKISDASAPEARVLKSLGVKDITDPAQSAIATIVHLDFLKHKFPTYLNNFPFDKKEQVTINEYLVALWNGLKPSLRHIREEILADRTAKNPTGYVGRILRSIHK